MAGVPSAAAAAGAAAAEAERDGEDNDGEQHAADVRRAEPGAAGMHGPYPRQPAISTPGQAAAANMN